MDKLDLRLLALIARRHPAIWDAIGPHGPAIADLHFAGSLVALNPQPIPPDPTQRVGLNPQPLPPRWLGELLATEVIRIAQSARALGVNVTKFAYEGDFVCGTPPIIVINPKGPVGPDGPEPGPPVMLRDFHLGAASVLATIDGPLAKHKVITTALAAHVKALEDRL